MVSRETSAAAGLEAEPSAAARLFGNRIDQARAFTAHLAEHGERLGLIGPAERARLWSRHVLNCAIVAPLIGSGRVGDIGSGAGLPGIVLAIARPEARLVLIEPMERRVDWLLEESRRLGLDNVEVVRARAEDSGLEGQLDQVTARAVSALAKLIPLAAPLLRPGGELVLMKGERVHDEIAKAERAMHKFGVTDSQVLVLGEGVLEEPTRVFRAKVG